MTSASASRGSTRVRLSAFFISSCCSCRLVSASVSCCWSVATVLCARTTSIGARVPISTCFLVSERVFCAKASDSFCTLTFSYANTRSQYMFSIWSTVVMICSRNATSEISRLFFAIWMNRVLGAKPKPCSRCWVSLEFKAGSSASGYRSRSGCRSWCAYW